MRGFRLWWNKIGKWRVPVTLGLRFVAVGVYDFWLLGASGATMVGWGGLGRDVHGRAN